MEFLAVFSTIILIANILCLILLIVLIGRFKELIDVGSHVRQNLGLMNKKALENINLLIASIDTYKDLPKPPKSPVIGDYGLPKIDTANLTFNVATLLTMRYMAIANILRVSTDKTISGEHVQRITLKMSALNSLYRQFYNTEFNVALVQTLFAGEPNFISFTDEGLTFRFIIQEEELTEGERQFIKEFSI